MKHFFTLLMCCLTTLSLGQEHQYPVVAATLMNVVYAGLENPLSIAVPGLASEDLVIEVDTVHQLFQQGNGWVLIPTIDSHRADIKVSKRNADNEQTELGTLSFRVKRIPDPSLTWGKARNGEGISKSILQYPPPVFAQMANFDFEVNARIVSFDLNFYRDGAVISMSSNPPLHRTMAQALQNLNVDDVVYIDNAVAAMPTLRTLAPIRVFVVENSIAP